MFICKETINGITYSIRNIKGNEYKFYTSQDGQVFDTCYIVAETDKDLVKQFRDYQLNY